jgi:hypothetical protein
MLEHKSEKIAESSFAAACPHVTEVQLAAGPPENQRLALRIYHNQPASLIKPVVRGEGGGGTKSAIYFWRVQPRVQEEVVAAILFPCFLCAASSVQL